MARVPPDANDVFVMMLNETGPVRTNAGSAGAAGNFTDYGEPIPNVQSLYGVAFTSA